MRLYASIYIFAYILLVTVAIILPFYGEEALTFMGNSISELGAQQTKGNWVMNIAITLMSLATLIYGSYALKQQWVQLVLLCFFSLSFGMTAGYQLAGLDNSIHYNYTQDALHSLFSVLSGFAFILLCIGIFFKIEVRKHKLQTVFAFLVAIVFSILQFQFPEIRGIFQRLMLFICFGWLFYALTTYNFDVGDATSFKRIKAYRKLKKNVSQDEK